MLRFSCPKTAKLSIFKPSEPNKKWSHEKSFDFRASELFNCFQKWLVEKSKYVWRKKNAESSNITLLSSKVGTLNDVDFHINQGKGEFRGIMMELEWGGGGGGGGGYALRSYSTPSPTKGSPLI